MDTNEIGREIRKTLTISTDTVDKIILDNVSVIQSDAKKQGQDEEKTRIINQIESLSTWAIHGRPVGPGISPNDSMVAKKGQYERLCAIERLYRIATTNKMSYSDFQTAARSRGLTDEIILPMYAAVKFNFGQLKTVIDENISLSS